MAGFKGPSIKRGIMVKEIKKRMDVSPYTSVRDMAKHVRVLENKIRIESQKYPSTSV